MEELIKKQTIIAGYIERFWNNLNELGKKNFSYEYLTARLKVLESYWRQMLDDQKVLFSYKGIESTDYIDIFTTADNHYNLAKRRIMACLRRSKPSGASSDANTASAES